MAGIEFRNIAKAFGDNTVIAGLTLSVADGEFVAIVGPSGCGKSTLLRLVSGLEQATSGRIEIGPRDVTALSAKERNVAMVFQNYALYPHMTVAQNIGFGLKVRGTARAERDATVRHAAELLGLADYLDRKPRTLSGGQRQRVAMGRAIVRQPDAFLMDEPLSNLDAQLRGQMRTEIRTLQRRLSATMLYVTHDQVEAMTMADRIVVLDKGEVQQVGAPLDLYEKPANRFVASFIGAPRMNIIGMDDRFQGASPPGAAEVGIRPAALIMGDEAGTLPIRWRGEVCEVEPLGEETLLHVANGDARVVVRRPGAAEALMGETVTVGFDPAAAHYFNAEGARVG